MTRFPPLSQISVLLPSEDAPPTLSCLCHQPPSPGLSHPRTVRWGGTEGSAARGFEPRVDLLAVRPGARSSLSAPGRQSGYWSHWAVAGLPEAASGRGLNSPCGFHAAGGDGRAPQTCPLTFPPQASSYEIATVGAGAGDPVRHKQLVMHRHGRWTSPGRTCVKPGSASWCAEEARCVLVREERESPRGRMWGRRTTARLTWLSHGARHVAMPDASEIAGVAPGGLCAPCFTGAGHCSQLLASISSSSLTATP